MYVVGVGDLIRVCHWFVMWFVFLDCGGLIVFCGFG